MPQTRTESNFGRDARRERLRRFRPGFKQPFLPAEDAGETGWLVTLGQYEFEHTTDQRGRRLLAGVRRPAHAKLNAAALNIRSTHSPAPPSGGAIFIYQSCDF
ncbi:MAG: hypothetical protein WCT37_02430 [Patescibacteria group bacterium]|jgi:hypothetical protein